MDGAPRKGKSQSKPVKDKRRSNSAKTLLPGRIITAGKLKYGRPLKDYK
jgi:hypothetical protein